MMKVLLWNSAQFAARKRLDSALYKEQPLKKAVKINNLMHLMTVLMKESICAKQFTKWEGNSLVNTYHTAFLYLHTSLRERKKT